MKQHFSPKLRFTSVRVNTVIFSNSAVIRYLSRLIDLLNVQGNYPFLKHRPIEAYGRTSGGIALRTHILGTTWT